MCNGCKLAVSGVPALEDVERRQTMESWSGRRYARAVGWRIGLFLAFTVGLPSLLVLGNRSGGCGRGSVCEAGWFFVGFGILLWPLVILVFAAVLA